MNIELYQVYINILYVNCILRYLKYIEIYLLLYSNSLWQPTRPKNCNIHWRS